MPDISQVEFVKQRPELTTRPKKFPESEKKYMLIKKSMLVSLGNRQYVRTQMLIDGELVEVEWLDLGPNVWARRLTPVLICAIIFAILWLGYGYIYLLALSQND